MYAKDPYETKYQFLINKRQSTGLKHFNDPIAFIEYSNNMHDVYKNINECNSSNINEVIRAVLNSLFFIFTKKILHAPKAPKASKEPKAQKRNQAKTQNANKRTKIKNALKNI